jgi:Tfp pilus assembly protein PilV
MVSTLKNRKGFTLIDVMVAMVVMCFAGIFITQFTIASFMTSKEARGRHVARLSAEKKLSDLSLQPYDTVGIGVIHTDYDTAYHCKRGWVLSSDPTTNVKFWTVMDTSYTFNNKPVVVCLYGSIK